MVVTEIYCLRLWWQEHWAPLCHEIRGWRQSMRIKLYNIDCCARNVSAVELCEPRLSVKATGWVDIHPKLQNQPVTIAIFLGPWHAYPLRVAWKREHSKKHKKQVYYLSSSLAKSFQSPLFAEPNINPAGIRVL